eukprot:15485541-Alexandrium_andersonii.AAC.1
MELSGAIPSSLEGALRGSVTERSGDRQLALALAVASSRLQRIARWLQTNGLYGISRPRGARPPCPGLGNRRT